MRRRLGWYDDKSQLFILKKRFLFSVSYLDCEQIISPLLPFSCAGVGLEGRDSHPVYYARANGTECQFYSLLKPQSSHLQNGLPRPHCFALHGFVEDQMSKLTSN